MIGLRKIKKICSIAMAAIIAAAMLPSALMTNGTVYAADGCLAMVGSGSVSNTQIERNEMVTINYTLDPGGTHTVTTTRPAIDIVFIADVSGSMDFYMDKGDSRTPKRMTVLKEASTTLINKFKANNYDRLGLVKFSTRAYPVQSLTKNYQIIQDQINALSPSGSTNIDEALTDAKTMFSASGSTTPKQIILLTDGKATAWTDEKDDNEVKDGERSSANAARAHGTILKNAGIKVFTIALALPGSDEIDLELLQSIATTTGGAAYQASSTSQLADIFDQISKTNEAPAKLTNVVLRQPVPEGFILAPGENASNVSYNSTTKEVVVHIGDIPYPFVEDNYQIAVNLIPDTAAGNYPLQDASVTYNNACNASEQFNISLGATLSVTIRIMDKYGNVYLGNSEGRQGQVQRKRTRDNELQWTIKESDAAVTDIQFVDLDHSVVRVSYRDGNGTKIDWDLKPMAPTEFVLKDADGTVITDTGWHQGAGTIAGIGGSKNQLPNSIVYANADFETNYIAGYQYSIGYENWNHFSSASGVSLPDGKDIGLHARAFTNAISGSPGIPIVGAIAAGKVSLDSTGPLISWKKISVDPSDDATFTITAIEDWSPVTSIQVRIDGDKTITAMAEKLVQNGNTYMYTFNLSEVAGYGTADKRVGWHQIEYEATSAGGTSYSSPDYFVVNPGPAGSLNPMAPYAAGDIADRPVTVQVASSHPVVERVFPAVIKPAFTVKEQYYLIKSNSNEPGSSDVWKKLPASRLTVTTETNVTKGNYFVYLKLVDDQGISSVTGPLAIEFDTEQNRN